MVVVAAVDRSEHAERIVNQAGSLAEAYNDSVDIVHVMSQSEFVDLQTGSVQQDDNPIEMDRIRQFASDIAEQAVGQISVPYETVGLVGTPEEEVVRYATDQDARYIIVGPEKRSPTGKAVFGSVAQSILLNANCPVVSLVSQS